MSLLTISPSGCVQRTNLRRLLINQHCGSVNLCENREPGSNLWRIGGFFVFLLALYTAPVLQDPVTEEALLLTHCYCIRNA